MKPLSRKQAPVTRAACALSAMLFIGCSSTQTSHFQEPTTAAPSPSAVASADGAIELPPAFSLVAADSVGLATFGQEIAGWGYSANDVALAEQDGE